MKHESTSSLVVIANRQPYSHFHTADGIQVQRPASGLVTALEPVLRTRGGLWIAHGNGSADVEAADASGELEVPPDQPTYRLKRVWLSPAEQRAYYDGFSNEALWPLFHLAHERPIFRESDWSTYCRVNARFAAAVPVETLRDEPNILVQDYHLALVPRMLRERMDGDSRRARIALVWHIPWVPFDLFSICPWAEQLLAGMLGADVITFHTVSHRNHFLQTCERLLESRIDPESGTVTYQGHKTRVRAIPIGIDPPSIDQAEENCSDDSTDRRRSLEKYEIQPRYFGLGVDRLDYTKGILERFRAIETFLDSNPTYIGEFTFLQICSPSRSDLPSYQTFSKQVFDTALEINLKFERRTLARHQVEPNEPHPTMKAPAIRLIQDHHEWQDLLPLYRTADFCLVSSLHDGMNLVAKEYVWSRGSTPGALILSRFAGASQELQDALIVNPYHIDEMARAIRTAIELDPAEKTRKMERMRARVLAHTAQHWANEIIDCLAG